VSAASAGGAGTLQATRPARGQVGGPLPAVGATTTRTITVADTRWPVAVTVVLDDWEPSSDGSGSDDVAVALTRPDGTTLAVPDPVLGGAGTRQRWLAWWPDQAGAYRLVVQTTAGAGTWWAEVSGGTTSGGTLSTPSGSTVQQPLAADPLPAGSAYRPLQPARVLDTREGGQGPLGAGEARRVVLAGSGGVPTDATAVVLNLTGTGATASTYLTVWPSGAARPTASNLNLVPGATVPNLVITGLGPDGAVQLYNDQGQAHAVADVVGYLVDAGPATPASSYRPLQPTRALDTRTSSLGPLGAGEARSLGLAGQHGVPASATAVVLNLTGTDPTAATYVTVWPGGAGRPNASTLNLVPGATAPNLVIAGLGPDGTVQLYNDQGTTHLIADVVGYLVAA
jgi:hypothetical protein